MPRPHRPASPPPHRPTAPPPHRPTAPPPHRPTAPPLSDGRRLIFATVMGGIIGWERRTSERAAGIRTMALISLGSALFTLCSMYSFASGPVSGWADVGWWSGGVVRWWDQCLIQTFTSHFPTSPTPTSHTTTLFLPRRWRGTPPAFRRQSLGMLRGHRAHL